MAGTFLQQASEIFIKGVPTSVGQPETTSTKDARVDSLAAPAADSPMQPGSRQEQLDAFLLWLLRFPLEQNNPRATTGTIPVWKSNGVVCFHTREKIPEVFKKLVIEGFLSAPVLNKDNRYVGMIDMLDLVTFTVQLFGAAEKYEQSTKGWTSFFQEEKRWKESTVREVMRRRPLVPRMPDPAYAVMQGFTLYHPFEVLARTGLRRMPVVDDRSNIVGLVTQSMLMSLLRQHAARLGPILDVRVREFETQLQPIIAVKDTDKVIDAFRIMADKNISALPVVDKDGVLIDTLSIRDLRGIGTDVERYHRLFYEVTFFKQLLKMEYRRQTPASPIYATRESTYGQVLRLMDDGNIHRIWVCNADDPLKPRPIGVISQKDMLLISLRECGL